MKLYSAILFLGICFLSSASKPPIRKCYILSSGHSFVISEPPGFNNQISTKIPGVLDGNIKTVFIWTDDFLYRIVCKESDTAMIDWKHLEKNSLEKTLSGLTEKNQLLSKDLYYKKIVGIINANLKGEYLSAHTSSEGMYLERDKQSDIVPYFFPILIENPYSEVKQLLSPFYINIYELDSISPETSICKLVGDVYIPDAILSGQRLNQQFKNVDLNNWMRELALSRFLKLNSNIDTPRSNTEYLAGFELKKQAFHLVDSSGVIIHENRCNNKSLWRRTDNDCDNPISCGLNYEFDNYCYNPRVGKPIRIFNHCPIEVGGVSCSYLDVQNSFLIFKTENKMNQMCENPAWQLTISGIGYWMIDVRSDEENHYFHPNVMAHLLTINSKSIYDFLNLK